MFQGQSIQVLSLDDGLVELRFDRTGEAINKLDARTVDEFRQATALIAAAPDVRGVRGVLVTSAKDVFIVGADVRPWPCRLPRPARWSRPRARHCSARPSISPPRSRRWR